MNMVVFYLLDYGSFSNGLKIVLDLSNYLNSIGIDSIVVFDDVAYELKKPPKLPYIKKTSNVKIDLENDIIVYPEHVTNNPLKAKKIIRWLLNKPLFLGCPAIHYEDTDFIASFSSLIDDSIPNLFYMLDDRAMIQKYRGIKKESQICLYFGKVDTSKICSKDALKKLKELTKEKKIKVITRRIPKERDLLFQEIAKSQYLISFDSLSNINYEAQLLGTPVYLIDDSYNATKIEYNVKSNAWLNNIKNEKELETALNNVYDSYLSWFVKKETEIRTFFDQVNNHFNKINTSSDYRKNHKAFLEQLSIKQQNEYIQAKKIIFVSILTYEDIPIKICRIINLKNPIYKKLIHAPRQVIIASLKKMHLYNIAKRVYKSIERNNPIIRNRSKIEAKDSI